MATGWFLIGMVSSGFVMLIVMGFMSWVRLNEQYSADRWARMQEAPWRKEQV